MTYKHSTTRAKSKNFRKLVRLFWKEKKKQKTVDDEVKAAIQEKFQRL